MGFGLGDRTIDIGDRQPIRRDEPPRTIETQPVDRVDRGIDPRPPIVRVEPPRTIETSPQSVDQWTWRPITSVPPATEPMQDVAPDDSIGGFYLGELFIPYWIPITAIGLWLFLKK